MTKRLRGILTAVAAALIVADFVVLGVIEREPDVASAQLRTIEAFVTHARGLPLHKRPHPQFVSRDKFAHMMSGALTPAQRAVYNDLKTPVDLDAHALGLLRHSQRLVAEEDRVRQLGALGFYDNRSNAIVIRSSARTLPASVRESLAHELTHAVQAQNGLLDSPPHSDASDYGQQEVWHAFVEGDATRIQFRYLRSLGASDRAQYIAAVRQNATRVTALKLDPFVYQETIANYSLGEEMTALLVARDRVGFDRMFGNVPASDIGEVNPLAIANNRATSNPKIPSGPRGAEVVDRGHLGAVFWYLTLASRLPGDEAIAAMDGWSGDSFVTTRDGRDALPCLHAALTGANPNATRALASALGHWRDASPVGMAAVSTNGDDVDVRACEPPAPTPLADGFARAMGSLTARNALVVTALLDGAPVPVAECLSQQYLAYLRTGAPRRRIYGGFVEAGAQLRARFQPMCSANATMMSAGPRT